MAIKSYSIEPPISGICKSWCIWAHSDKTNSMFPIVYLRKPKHLSADSFEKIVSHLYFDGLHPDIIEIEER